ncbi:MAG TPA: T9SS type A sorting domain-containing protein [Fluviicola sp.]|nr:T9SS type A sorting domain-containing protein [Fluviicola sp.]
MKKRYVLLTVLASLSLHLSAQHYADKWHFGSKAGIDFTSGTPVAITNSELNTVEGSASIADPITGALLFYTDGINVWNDNNTLMPNGTGLMGGSSSTQPALIVPVPENSTQYYIFTTDETGGSLGLRYSIVDMTLDGGNGNVTVKNALLKTPVAEKITAVEDHGTSNYWLVAHGWGNNSFYSFKISPTGIDSAVVSNVGTVHDSGVIQNSYGQMKFNPCGDMLALAIGYMDIVEFFDFNIITGVISNPRTITYTDHVYGIEFSENSNALYVSTYDANGTLMQYDLSITNLGAMIASAAIISVTIDTYPLQRGPDGKIYVAKSFNQYLGVINSPNTIGTGCNYVDMGFDLDPTFMGLNSALGLPNMVTSFMGGTANCIGSTNSVEDLEALSNVIFPNPSNSNFTFVSKHNHSSVVVTDVSGKIVDTYSNITNGTEFDFGHNYAPGIYLVTATSGNTTSIKKVMKTE